jgi:hypothetical protein
MKKTAVILMSIGLMLFLMSTIVTAQEKPAAEGKAAPAKVVHKYIGSTKCKMCHGASTGNQYKIWADSKHAKAYEALGTQEADSVGMKLGVERPQESDKCLVCHVTGFSAPTEAKAATFDKSEGVGCEACHGPGSDYMSMKVMKDKPTAIAAGLIVPNEKTCVGCHNEKSPTYKTFVMADFVKKIAHPIVKAKTETPSGTQGK